MAFSNNPILKHEFESWAGTWVYSIYDEEDNPGSGNHKPLNIIKSEGVNQISGSAKFDVKKYIYPVQELFSILDEDDYLFNKLQNENSSRFRLDVTLNGSLKNRLNILTEKIDSEITNFASDLPLVCFDGIVNLKEMDFNLSGYYSIFSFFETVLNKVGHEIPIEFMFDLKHKNANGTYLPDLARFRVDEILNDENDRNYYNVLEHVLSVFELKLFQNDGSWWIQQQNIKNASRTIYTKAISDPSLQFKFTYNFNPAVSLNSGILDGSKKTTLPVHSLIKHKFNVVSDNQGTTENFLFTTWNNDFTIPNGWDLLAGSFSRADGNDGLRADQNNGLSQLKQVQKRIFKGGDTIVLDIDFTIYDDVNSLANYDVEFAKIKLKDLNGGDDYYIVKSMSGYDTQVTEERLVHQITTSMGTSQITVNINEDVEIPAGFIGIIEITIDCGDHTFDPDNDSIAEFQRIDFDKFKVDINNPITDIDYTYHHSKNSTKNALEFEPTIIDTNFDNFSNCIQFLYDSSDDIWLPSFHWNNNDSLVYRKSRIILSNVSKTSNGLKLNLDQDSLNINLKNSILYNGVYYNPFYILYDKIENVAQVYSIELNNDLTNPNEIIEINVN